MSGRRRRLRARSPTSSCSTCFISRTVFCSPGLQPGAQERPSRGWEDGRECRSQPHHQRRRRWEAAHAATRAASHITRPWRQGVGGPPITHTCAGSGSIGMRFRILSGKSSSTCRGAGGGGHTGRAMGIMPGARCDPSRQAPAPADSTRQAGGGGSAGQSGARLPPLTSFFSRLTMMWLSSSSCSSTRLLLPLRAGGRAAASSRLHICSACLLGGRVWAPGGGRRPAAATAAAQPRSLRLPEVVAAVRGLHVVLRRLAVAVSAVRWVGRKMLHGAGWTGQHSSPKPKAAPTVQARQAGSQAAAPTSGQTPEAPPGSRGAAC